MIKNLSNTLRILVCAIFTMQLMGCGTLMYPERRGQRGGSLDAGVAVLDGVGLLFGIIPGVIAFAVDFSNGTIYLPERTRIGFLDFKNIKEVKFDPKHTDFAKLEGIIKGQTGCEVKLTQGTLRLTQLKSLKEMREQFAKVELANDRIALLRSGNEYIE